MNVTEAVHLIQDIGFINSKPCVWADLGCGSGTFTKALATLLPSQSTVYAVDENRNTIDDYAGVSIENVRLNFETEPLPFYTLDGILMANSLHFVKDKIELLQKLKSHVTQNSQFLIVEYEIKTTNPWVPFPLPYGLVKQLFSDIGFNTSQYLGDRDSIYSTGKMYACVVSA